MQKIDFEIAKGLDEWLDNENVCCFNVYTKDYFNADDKDMSTSDNIKDNTNVIKSNNANFNENNTQEIIPDNVIRIETQDGSGEFIEIVFDDLEEWRNKSSGAIKPLFSPLGGIVDEALESLENVSIIGDALAMLGTVKNPKNAKNIIKKKSLTKDEVLQIVDKLPKNVRDKRRRIVENKEELDKLWKKLTKNSKELENKVDKKYGQPIYMRKLDDQTIIQYKKASKSGGEIIEINSNKPRENLRTIHIENGVKNEV
ncbi:hypothetical protein ELQ16_09615 [Campylobacter sp. US33a]|nr:hypothetical protein ELQ16_09615 [Campylobacter sp. US33a]